MRIMTRVWVAAAIITALASSANAAELSGTREAHKRDGLAVTKFLCWLDGADKSRLTEMEQRLGKAMSAAGSFTFMHVDHATPPSISDKFLDAVQGVLAGAMSPQEAMQLTEDAAIRTRGKV